MVSTGGLPPYQQSGVVGGLQGSTSLGEPCIEQGCFDCNGQYDRHELHQQAGTSQDSHRDARLLFQSWSGDTGQAHRWEAECAGRFFVAKGQILPTEWSLSPRVFSRICQRLGTPQVDLFATSLNSKTSGLCVSIPRSSSVGRGLPVLALEGNLGVCISPNSHSPSGIGENSVSQLQNSVLGCSIQAPRVVAQPIASAPGSRATVASACSRPPQAAPDRGLSPVPGVPRPSHVGLIKQAMRDKGFSERSAISITKSIAVSTATVYDAKWKIFTDWCGGRQIDPLRTSVPQLAQFLEHKRGGGLSSWHPGGI